MSDPKLSRYLATKAAKAQKRRWKKKKEEEKMFPKYRWLEEESIGDAEFTCSKCGTKLKFEVMNIETKYECPNCGTSYKLIHPPVYVKEEE